MSEEEKKEANLHSNPDAQIMKKFLIWLNHKKLQEVVTYNREKMGEIETFNGDREKILAHGKTLTKEERKEYYKSVIYNLYVIRGAFKRDMYMEGIGLKDFLENEIKKIDEEINSNNYMEIYTTLFI